MSVKRRGISLQSVGRPAQRDFYEYAHRVDGLVKLLSTCQPPFVVAVEGEWGRGKSTLIDMVIARLRKRKAFAKNIVRYYPWRYHLAEFEDAWESLVATISRSISTDKYPIRYLDRLARLVTRNNLLRLAWRVGMPVATTFVPDATLITGVADAVHREIKGRPRVGPRYAIFDEVRIQLEELARDRRILLVIDDLDRCEPPGVANVLRCIPTLFAPLPSGPNYVLLLGIDRKATTEALQRASGWDTAYVAGFIDKVINVHVTLPMLQRGEGDKERAAQNILQAIRGGGNRRPRPLNHPSSGATTLFDIPENRCESIAKFMHNNPREIERFCILFDLKWDSRFVANSAADCAKQTPRHRTFDFANWVAQFRDRLIPGDADANKKAIRAAIDGKPQKAKGLPCEPFLDTSEFLEVHRVYWDNAWSAQP